LNCHTLFDTQGEPFYHTNATGFHIFPSGAVGPDLSDIYTLLKPAGYNVFINEVFGGKNALYENDGSLQMTGDGSTGPLAYDITNIDSNIANDLGENGNPEPYFTKPLLALNAPVSEYVGEGTNGYSNVYTSANALQESCFLCHYVAGYNGISSMIPNGSGGLTSGGMIITDGGNIFPVPTEQMDIGSAQCNYMGDWIGGGSGGEGFGNSGALCTQSVTVGGTNVTFDAIISDTLDDPEYNTLRNGPIDEYPWPAVAAAPSSVSAATGSATGEVNLSWTSTNSSTGQLALDFVVLESSTSSGPFTPVGSVIIADNPTQSYSYTVNGLTSGTTYYFEVEAIATIGITASSSVSAAAK
jgi:hypothetical protein